MNDTSGQSLRGYGTLSEALDGETFPLSKQDLYYAVGDLELPLAHGGANVPIRLLLDRLDQDEFRSVGQTLEALHKVADHMRSAPSEAEESADAQPV